MCRSFVAYVKASGIGKGGACHLFLFRHTCATLMHENGADIGFISRLGSGLGHAELTTTQIYTQVAIRMLKEIHTATHPAKLENTTLDELKAELEDDDS
ncbi:MAG: tyrosine-type recombinase/integrase [Opitutales bacterium]